MGHKIILTAGRANCENRIKELKYDFAVDKFNQRNFFATEATLCTIMLSYNLMSFFRKALLKFRVIFYENFIRKIFLMTDLGLNKNHCV
jgi:hypothetical protein